MHDKIEEGRSMEQGKPRERINEREREDEKENRKKEILMIKIELQFYPSFIYSTQTNWVLWSKWKGVHC